jgi:hypothetical protein
MPLLPVPGNCWTIRAFREHLEQGPAVLVHDLLQALRQHDDVEFVAIEALRRDRHNLVCEIEIIRKAGSADLRVRVA